MVYRTPLSLLTGFFLSLLTNLIAPFKIGHPATGFILFVVFNFFSFTAFSQANPITSAPPAAGYPRHETDAQTQIQLTLDADIAVFSCPGACAGWTVTIGGVPATVTSVSGAGRAVIINFTPAVGIGQAVTVSFTGGNGINPFGAITSYNDRVIACTDFTFQAYLENTPPCAPVDPINKMVFGVNRAARNSMRWATTTKQVRIHWQTNGAVPFNDINIFESTATGVSQANSYFITVDAATSPWVYPANDLVCGYTSYWRIKLQVGPTITSCPLANAPQTQTYASHNTDALNEGTGELRLPPTVANSNLVCLGENVDMTFSDNTQLNCNNPAPAAPIPVNDEIRWVRVVYGSQDLGAANNIPNVTVDGTPVTDPSGNLLIAGGYFPVAPATTTFGAPDAFGVVEITRPVNGPRGILELIETTSPAGQIVGQRFWVRLEYWNICNAYSTGDFSNVRTVENFIEIIDTPAPPVAPSRDICSGDSRQLSVSPTVPGLTYRWYLTMQNAIDNVNVQVTNANFTPTNLQAPAGASTNFFVTATAGNGCVSTPTTVTLKRRSALSNAGLSIQGPTNLCPTSSYTFQVNVPPAAGAPGSEPTRYRWTIPAGWSVVPASGLGQSVTLTTNGVVGAQTITVDYEYDNLTSNSTRCGVNFNLPVNIRARPTASITPNPADICEGTALLLNGNPSLPPAAAGFTPTISAHTWGGSTGVLDATNIQQPTVQASSSPGSYPLTYTVTADYGGGVSCSSVPVNRTVNISVSPIVSEAGPPQALCTALDGFTATMDASPAAPGIGTWSLVSTVPPALPMPTFSNINSRTSTVTITAGNEGSYTLRWTVSNPPCTSQDDVVIDFGSNPTDPNAGAVQQICGTSTNMAGNTITIGTGTWSVTSAPPGGTLSITSPNSPTSAVSLSGANVFGTYQLRWRSQSGTCAPEDSFVNVTFSRPATATVGANFTTCVDGVALAPIALTGGTVGDGSGAATQQGRWEIVSGTGTFTSNNGNPGSSIVGPTINDSYRPSATDFTNGSVQLRLVALDPDVGGPCGNVNSTTLTITFDRLPAAANAGPATMETCDPTINLAGIAATNGGTGTWSIGSALYYQTFTNPNGTGLSGPNPHALTFTHASGWTITAPNTATLLANDDYLRVESNVMEARDVNDELVWRSPSINITAQPNVTISIQLAESGGMDGAPNLDYIRAFYRLNGAGPEIPIGNIDDDAAVDGAFTTFNVSGISGTSLEVIVRVMNNAADEFHRFDNVFVSSAGTSLPLIADINSPTTSISNLSVGTTTFTWTVASALGVCSSSNDQVAVTRHASPVNNAQTPGLCENTPGSADATVTLAFLTSLNDDITGIIGSTNRTVQFFSDAGRTVPFPASDVLSNAEIVYTRVIRTDVTPNCPTDGTVTFTVNARPAALDQNPEYCEDAVGSNTRTGIDLTLLDMAVKNNVVANSVAWFTSLGPDVPVADPTNVTANDGTSFFARVTDGNGCTNEAEIEIQLNPIPPPNALIGPTAVCADPSAVTLYQLTVNNSLAGYTYTWSIPEPPFDRIIGGTAADFLVLLSFPTVATNNISVIETSDKGCVGQPNVKTITVDSSPPVIEILDPGGSPGPGSVCEGEAGVVYTVDDLANTTYAWTVPPGSSIIAGQGTFEITVNFGTIAGLISVVPTTTTGCAGNPDDYSVAINPRPSLNTLPNTVCSDAPASITLSGIGAATYNITNVSVPPGLSPASRPLINGAISTEIFNDVFTNTTGGNLTVQYTVVPVSALGCEGTAQIVNLTIRPEPVLASGLNDVICSTTEEVGVVLSVASGSFPADQYEISSINIGPGLVQTAGAQAIPGTGYTSGVLLDDRWQNLSGVPATVEYFIHPRNSSTGCLGDPAIPVLVTVNPEPIVPALADEPICSGDSPTTTITPSIPGSTFNWTVVSVSGPITGNTNGSGPSGSAITDVLINNGLAAGSVTYAVTATGPGAMGSCSGQAVNFVVNVNPSPTANNISTTVCSDTPGGSTFLIDLTTLQNAVNSGGGVTFTWSEDFSMAPVIATPTAHTLNNGDPVFVEVDNGQCTKIATVLYTINPSPSVVATITSNYNGFQLSCNGASDGQITAVPADGTGPYLFSIDGGTSFFTSNIFNGLSVAGNNYTIRVRDANSCFVNSTPLTIVPPTAVSAVAAITSNYNGEDVSCQAASDGVITITPAGGTGTYTFRLLELPSNTTGDATGVYTGLRAGAYTFVVRDANNCQFTTPTITVTEPTPVTATATLTSPVSCNGNSDGVITVAAAGGTPAAGPTYSFTLNQAPFTVNTTGVFNGLPAGTYTVNVEDDNGCVRTSNIVSVTEPSPLTAFASVTSNYNGAKISCPGANDAQVTAVANGGNGGYTYVLDQDPLNLTGAADGSFENLGPGTYSITVTDAGLCSVTSLTVTVSEPTPISASAIITGTISCNGGSDGQITVSASGGTGAYTFEQINPAGLTNVSGIFSGLAQGTYDFEVRDLNGCADVVQLTINHPTMVTASSAVTSNYNGAQISCNGASNGVITVTGAGGTGSLTYVFDQFALTNTTGQFTGVFTGVPAGTGYTFTVRDSKNCTVATLPIAVTQPTVVTASGVVSSNFNGEDISCVGASDGQITVTPAGGTGTYSFKLDQVPSNTSGDLSGIYTGLNAGIYTITARDINNCFIVTAPITISPPTALTATAAVTSNYNGRQVSCNGASDGMITVTPGGGVPGYTFVLNEIPANLTGAASGVFTGIPAGAYTITVRDLNNCQFVTASITISEPSLVAASAAVTSNYNGQQIRCVGASDGTIRVIASGGTLPYTYTFVEIPGNVTGATTGIFTGVPAGTYTFNARDVNNCAVVTTSVTITPPTLLTASSAVTSNYNGSQISCNGASDGVVTVTTTGGTGVLQYTFDQFALSNTTGQFSGVFTGVPAGVGYTFTVRDANNCTITTAGINVTQPVVVAASGVVSSNFNGEDISCVGALDGQITITATGGTGAYTYRLDQSPLNTSGNATGIYTGLGAGIYTVTVRDVNSCFIITAPITITAPPTLTATAAVTSNYNGQQISCNGVSDGIITVTPGGGVPGYNFVLNEIPGNVTGLASGVFTGIPAGSYTITVTDLNLCQRITTSVTISEPAVVTATAAITSNYNGEDVSCNGSSDGIIRVTPAGGTTPYAYTFVEIPANVTGATTGIFTGIPAGTYTFNVRDVNNCTIVTTAITVNEPTIVVASALVTSNYNGSQISCNGQNDGVITITSSGGTGDATYIFDQFAVANQSGRFSGVFTSVPAGTGYTFTVRDANNCAVVTTAIDVTQPGALNASGTATSDFNGFDVRCFTETNGQITITATGGHGTLNYMLLEDAGNLSGLTSGVFDNLRAGSFRARINDVNGCLFTTTAIVVTQPNNLAITINKTSSYNGFDVSCIGAADGEISVITTTGGASGYTYALDGFPGNTTGQATGIFTGVTAGLYTITVTDVNTCSRQSLPVILTDPLPLFEGIIGLDKAICLGADPTAFTELATAFGGIGNYTYQWRESTDGTTFSDVAGAMSATFDPPAITQTTFYKREITSGTCTTLESNTVSVTVNPLPTAALAPSETPVCEGDFFLLEFTFTGQAPFFFDFNDGTTFTNDRLGAANTPVPVLNYTNTTTYTLTEVRDFNGCVAPVLPPGVTVPVVKINPAFAITSSPAQCSGGQFDFQFTVDPDVEYTWIWGDGTPDMVIPANSLASGTQSVNHIYNSVSTSGNTNFPVILTAINNVEGCGPKQTNQSVQIFPNILINVFPDRTVVCSGEQINIANPTLGGTTHTWTIIRQSDGAVIPPTPLVGNSPTNQSFTINNNEVGAINPDVYNIVYDVTNGLCNAQQVIPVTVYREVVADFDEGTVPPFVGGHALVTITNLSQPIDLTDFSYDWEFGTAASPPTQSGAGPFVVDYTSPGFKTVRLTAVNTVALADGVNCSSEFEKTFNVVLPPLVANFTFTPQAACFPASIEITQNLSTGDTYEWQVRDQSNRLIGTSVAPNPIFSIVNPGQYTIYLTTRNSLTLQSAQADNSGSGPNSIGDPVDIYDKPFAAFQARPSIVYVPDMAVETYNLSSSPVDYLTNTYYPIKYQWYFGDGTFLPETGENPDPFDPNSGFQPSHFYANEGNYDIELIAINDHGNGIECRDTTTQRIQAKAAGFTRVPNAFTPSPNGPSGGATGGNGNGATMNDIFLPIAKGIIDFQMQIFDRWGNLVFESNDKTIGWDGYDRNGTLMPAGVYVYKLSLRLSNEQRSTQIGDVTLIR